MLHSILCNLDIKRIVFDPISFLDFMVINILNSHEMNNVKFCNQSPHIFEPLKMILTVISRTCSFVERPILNFIPLIFVKSLLSKRYIAVLNILQRCPCQCSLEFWALKYINWYSILIPLNKKILLKKAFHCHYHFVSRASILF